MPKSDSKGCRRKGCIIPLASIALLIALFVGREVYLALTATPGSAVDYHALADELVASHQPTEGENGWDLLLEAVARMQQMDERMGKQMDDPGYYSNGYSVLIDPDAEWADEGHVPSREDMMAAGREGLAGLREAGVWDLLDQLARSPRVMSPLPKKGVLLDVPLSELGQVLSLAQPLRARMWASHEAGNDADVAAAFVQGCGLARALMYQFGLIYNLTGLATYSYSDGQLRNILAERPLDEQSLSMIADALDMMARTPPVTAL